MGFEAAFTLAVLFATVGLLAAEVLSPDILLLAALEALLLGGVLDLETALGGFANPTLLAIGGLYVVAGALRETGALDKAGELLLGGVRSLRLVLLRLGVAAAAGSAFLNNTPIVAMGVPAVRGWANRRRVSPSKLLMPLSFASIFGGMCTLIGTSTNLVTDGLLRTHALPGLGFFELAWVGVPCAAIGILYLAFVAPAVLGAREDVRRAEEREQAELVEVELVTDSPLAGRTVAEAGFEHLPGLDLVRIGRPGREIAPVDERAELEPGDRLFFASEEQTTEQVLEGEGLAGLRLASKRTERGDDGESELHEAVVRAGSRLIGSKVAEVGFLERFGAAVTAVRRGGKRLPGPIGEIRLRAGDILMLDTRPGFREAFEDAGELFVATEAGRPVSPQVTRRPRRSSRNMWLAVVVLASVVTLAVTGVVHIAEAALLGGIGSVALGLIGPGRARDAIDWSVLLVIGAALGLATALESSGAAAQMGDAIVGVSAGLGEIGVLGGVLVATMLLTGLLTNNAAAALMFPIALSVAETQGLDARPLMIGITIAASLSLWTPLGYQTNLMVYGPGNYRFSDFTRLGLPLQLLLAGVAAAIIPVVWPL